MGGGLERSTGAQPPICSLPLSLREREKGQALAVAVALALAQATRGGRREAVQLFYQKSQSETDAAKPSKEINP